MYSGAAEQLAYEGNICNLCLTSHDGEVDAAEISKGYITTLEGHRPFITSQHGYFETSKELQSTTCTDLYT